MNRYDGITGRVERMPEPEPVMYQSPPLFIDGENGEDKKPSGQSGILGGLGGGLGGILSKFSISNFELEDIMLAGVLYLLYRESGDIEFLLIAGAMLFL